MNVILADVLGYCMGVRRAVESAETALIQNKDKKVFSFGPLIHNKITLDALKNKGLSVIEEDSIESIDENSAVIIRAHGVSPQISAQLLNRKCTIINATCPKVMASQKNAAKYSSLGYTVILAGDKNHGEVTGIAGYAGDNFVLIENIQDAQNFSSEIPGEKAVLLSQTTFSAEEFNSIASILSAKIKELKVLNTICSATRERQDALKKLCPSVDGVIVVGGKNSANTQRLFQIASESCKKAVLIETADEIPAEFFQLESVGITAGASTPDSVILSVKESLHNH